VQRVAKRTGHKIKRVRLNEQAKIRRYRGKLQWKGDLGKSRRS
jgi:hypothetical protein